MFSEHWSVTCNGYKIYQNIVRCIIAFPLSSLTYDLNIIVAAGRQMSQFDLFLGEV